jgi:hypothetical protein
MSIYTEKRIDYLDDESEVAYIAGGKKAEKIRRNLTKHYPNKDEARELRKIMASTGLSEEEIRQDPKYRKQLSEAQKDGQKRKRDQITKWYQKMIKKACRQTKLVPQHPETLKVLDELLKNTNLRWYMRLYSNHQPMSAENAVKQFAKK